MEWDRIASRHHEQAELRALRRKVIDQSEVIRVLEARLERLERFADPWNDDEYMCPNCVTPWKCNGPHELPEWES